MDEFGKNVWQGIALGVGLGFGFFAFKGLVYLGSKAAQQVGGLINID